MYTNPITFEDNGKSVTLKWVSENQFPLPKQILVIDDTFPAHRFVSLASQGTSFLWNGNFNNAKNLLQAVKRRLIRPQSLDSDMAKEFYRHRQFQAHQAQLLGRLFIRVESDLSITLPKAPDLREAIQSAIAPPCEPFLISLRELLGFVGALEWRKKGVPIAVLDGRKIHCHYGVFSPVRGEYLDLVANAPMPANIKTAFDIGTGSGVIAAILASRGVQSIIATDMDSRALDCASENIKNLNYEKQVQVLKANLFPEGKADLIVCNPPWLPAKPTSAIERAVYDENSLMLKSFLNGVGGHLNPSGEAWLIISDLAEHLGLRRPNDLDDWMAQAGLENVETLQTRPTHAKAKDSEDLLHSAREKEITKLYRLKLK